MYISIRLPKEFGSFHRIQKENYPFNSLFTSYLAAVSRLGMSMNMDVDELVGYLEDRIFEGQRLPDVPMGDEPVNIRYRTEDPDVTKYIKDSVLTNRMAIMYIARMTLRLSAAYGTSLFRLTRLIQDQDSVEVTRRNRKAKEPAGQEPAPVREHPPVRKKESVETAVPRIGRRLETAQPVSQTSDVSAVLASARAARAAVSALTGLTGETDPPAEPERTPVYENVGQAAVEEETGETGDADVVMTNPHLSEFLG